MYAMRLETLLTENVLKQQKEPFNILMYFYPLSVCLPVIANIEKKCLTYQNSY